MLRLSLVFVAAFLVTTCADSTSPRGTCFRGTLGAEAVESGTVAANDCAFTVQGGKVGYADYRVHLDQGQRYLFTLSTTGQWQPTLQLLQPQHDDSIMVAGWSDTDGIDVRTSEILFVPPYSGTFTLRVISNSGTNGSYTLRSRSCGGSSTEIFGDTPIGTSGTISGSSCVVHDRFLDADSTHADLFVLYLGRNESKVISVKRTSGTLAPAFILTGPFLERPAGFSRQVTVAAGDSVSSTVTGGNVAGDYILAVGAARYEQYGGYQLVVSPAP
jgi:hypothetical protein